MAARLRVAAIEAEDAPEVGRAANDPAAAGSGAMADANRKAKEDADADADVDASARAKTDAKTSAEISAADPQDSTDAARLDTNPERPASDLIAGSEQVTTISTIGAQCGHSRLVLALLKEGDKFQMKVQEMRPPMFEVGLDRGQSSKYSDEHRKMLANLRRHEKAPVEAWLQKYRKIRHTETMSSERRLLYMCMLENLQACWKASLRQLDRRAQLLETACSFYELAEQVAQAAEQAESHVQRCRADFLAGPTCARFGEARAELLRLNKRLQDALEAAERKQHQLAELIRSIASANLADARSNQLVSGAQSLIQYIESYLEPQRKRRQQLADVLKTSSQMAGRGLSSAQQLNRADGAKKTQVGAKMSLLREISDFNDLLYVDNWLSLKIEQLNSSLLSSLGVGDLDSRTVLSKHEQILLECRTIEEATMLFRGKNIHAIKSVAQDEAKGKERTQQDLFERQKLLSTKARDVITIVEARIALLRRTIDFHVRSKEATCDIGKMMRRLQVDNSLQSVEFVANELELKDVSSVVASGATIISELQQLQLAQQHGQRSSLVNLNLATSGIRMAIDQLSQELAHLKTVLNQRKLVLLNEDANKMAANFKQKCSQLHFWLQKQVESFLLSNSRLALDSEGARRFCQSHQQLRRQVQTKTLEVEALLRSLSSLTEESFEAKSKLGESIQRSLDELRHDWILVTNCLERRAELAAKYLGLLTAACALDKELGWLQKFQSGQTGELPERSDEEIEANIEQISQQLGEQIRLFRLDLQKGGTELAVGSRQSGQPGERQVSELNRSQMLEHAENLFGQLAARKRSLWAGRERSSAGSARRQQRAQVASGEESAKLAAPKFRRALSDRWALPFSPVELECELEPESAQAGRCQLEWLMGDFRKIPASIRHSTSREGSKHKLTIHNLGPQCCGTYLARAWNSAGQAVSRCELRLAGMQRVQGEQPVASRNESSLLAHRWPPQAKGVARREQGPRPSAESKAMARIVQGVDSLKQDDARHSAAGQQATQAADKLLPVTESRYAGRPAGPEQQSKLQLRAASDGTSGSPSSSTSLSRSSSRSPFDGTPRPPKFVQPVGQSQSQPSSLLCVVSGNPAPSVEWLHNERRVAVARCAPRDRSAADEGSIFKLTIEALNEQTRGQYTCRASNRVGQTSSKFTLSK